MGHLGPWVATEQVFAPQSFPPPPPHEVGPPKGYHGAFQGLLPESMLMIRCLLALLLVAGVATAQQSAPLWTNDLGGLRARCAEEPANIGLKLRLARALLQDTPEAAHPSERLARAKEAEEQLSAVLKQAPSARVPLEVLTLVEYRIGDMDKVVDLGGRLLRRYPGHEEVARRVMKAYIRLGRFDDAAAAVLGWLQSGAVHSFGGVMGLMGTFSRIPDARKALGAALAKASASPSASVDMRLFRGAFLSECGDYLGAWKLVKEAERLGACNLRTGQRPFLALRLVTHCIEPDPGPGSEPSTSVEKLQAAAAKAPKHAGLQMRLARMLHRRGDKEAALAAYRKACQLSPRYWAASQLCGDLLIEMKRPAEAIEPLRRGVALLPGFQPAQLRLAQALVLAGKSVEASKILVQSGSLFAPDALTRSLIKKAAQADPQVVSVFEKAATADEKNPTLLGHLALARYFAGESGLARQAAMEAENRGLVGPSGLPAAILWEVFDRKPPESPSRLHR